MDSTGKTVAGLMVVGHCILAVWVLVVVLCCCCCCISMCCCSCVGRWYQKESKDDLPVDEDTVISDAVLQSDDESVAEYNSPSHDPDQIEITPQVSAPLFQPSSEALAMQHPGEAANVSDIQVEVVASGYSLDLDNPLSVDDFDFLSYSHRSEDETQQDLDAELETSPRQPELDPVSQDSTALPKAAPGAPRGARRLLQVTTRPALPIISEADLISFFEQDQSQPGCMDNQTAEDHDTQSGGSSSDGASKARELSALKPQEPSDTTSLNPFADV